MLRVGPRKQQAAPEQEEMPVVEAPMGQEEAVSEPAMAMESDEEDFQPLHFVSQNTAGYMGPEYGPFECQRCSHFQPDGSCGIVEGPIDPQGCCNLFDPPSDGGGEEAHDGPAEEMVKPVDDGDEEEGY